LSHAKRKYDDIAEQWPTACAEIGALIGELYAIERLVPGAFPGDPAAQVLRRQLRQERSQSVLDRIRHWATVQVGLPRSEFGKAVRYMLDRWAGLTRFIDDLLVPLDNNIPPQNARSVVPSSVARITTAHDRCAARRSRPSSIRSARPRSWVAWTRTRICSWRSTPRSLGPAPSHTPKTF
jgi:hypothetical protein